MGSHWSYLIRRVTCLDLRFDKITDKYYGKQACERGQAKNGGTARAGRRQEMRLVWTKMVVVAMKMETSGQTWGMCKAVLWMGLDDGLDTEHEWREMTTITPKFLAWLVEWEVCGIIPWVKEYWKGTRLEEERSWVYHWTCRVWGDFEISQWAYRVGN